MTRFGPLQPDLFVSFNPSEAALARAPIDELMAMLAGLRTVDRLPWPDAAAAMAEEQRALGLARLAGPAGAGLVAAILQETERLLSTTI